MNLETFAVIIGLTVTIGGIAYSALKGLFQGYKALDNKFDNLEDTHRAELHELEIKVLSLQGEIKNLMAKTELLDAKNTQALTRLEANIYKLQTAVLTLSNGLAKYTEFKPRGENGYPIEDEPTIIRKRNQ